MTKKQLVESKIKKIVMEELSKKDIKYRILTKDRKIKYAGTGRDSWFTLEKAKSLVNRKNGEMIYEFDAEGRPMWEIF